MLDWELVYLCICVMILLAVLCLAFLIREAIINERRKKVKDKLNKIYGWFGIEEDGKMNKRYYYDNNYVYSDTDSINNVSHETLRKERWYK